MLKQISFDKIESQIDNSSSRHSKIKNQFLNQTLIAKNAIGKKQAQFYGKKFMFDQDELAAKLIRDPKIKENRKIVDNLNS